MALALIGVAYLILRPPRGLADGPVIVRCRSGHLFTTLWIPFGSLKAVRLGPLRFQYCPVGRHWTLVTRVDPAELTAAERRFAEDHPDSLIP